jgi:hypothetical protein
MAEAAAGDPEAAQLEGGVPISTPHGPSPLSLFHTRARALEQPPKCLVGFWRSVPPGADWWARCAAGAGAVRAATRHKWRGPIDGPKHRFGYEISVGELKF